MESFIYFILTHLIMVLCFVSLGHFCFNLQELYDNLEKQRPNLFRLASDTDEKDNEGISKCLNYFVGLSMS